MFITYYLESYFYFFICLCERKQMIYLLLLLIMFVILQKFTKWDNSEESTNNIYFGFSSTYITDCTICTTTPGTNIFRWQLYQT